MRDAENEVLVNTQADTHTTALVEDKTLCVTLGNVEAEAQVNTLA